MNDSSNYILEFFFSFLPIKWINFRLICCVFLFVTFYSLKLHLFILTHVTKLGTDWQPLFRLTYYKHQTASFKFLKKMTKDNGCAGYCYVQYLPFRRHVYIYSSGSPVGSCKYLILAPLTVKVMFYFKTWTYGQPMK